LKNNLIRKINVSSKKLYLSGGEMFSRVGARLAGNRFYCLE